MYTVLERFRDLQDDGRTYSPGDTYPRDGLAVTQARLDELSGSNNRVGRPLIEAGGKRQEAEGKRQEPTAKRRRA